MIQNIRHVGIVVGNLEEGIKFYKKLGFKPSTKGVITAKESTGYYGSNRKIRWQKMYVENLDKGTGEDVIELYEVADDVGFQGYNHISFTVNDIQKCWKFFDKKGLLISRKIIENNGHKLFFIADPWFNMLEIVQEPK